MALVNRGIWEGKLKPLGGLGRLEALVDLLIQGQTPVRATFDRYQVVIMAADNGVSREGISIYSPMDSRQIVAAHLDGSAAPVIFLNRIGKTEVLVDVGLFESIDSEKVWNYRIRAGTADFQWEPAMNRNEAIRAIDVGVLVAERLGDLDIIGIGEIGVGNTVASAAVLSALLGIYPEEVVDRGSGVADKVLARRVDIIKKALAQHQPRETDALDVLSKVGCLELAAMAGFILRAAEKRLPVMLDGYVASVAALLATRLAGVGNHRLVASHLSQEKGHQLALRELGLEPLFDFNLNYGEGLGAAMGLFLCELAFLFWRGIGDSI